MVLGVIDTAKPSSKFFEHQGNCPMSVAGVVNYYLLKLSGSVVAFELLPWSTSRFWCDYRIAVTFVLLCFADC
jgi:hypothetical protein